jgi:hypothetical protein
MAVKRRDTKNGLTTKKGTSSPSNGTKKDKSKDACDDKILNTTRASKICAAFGFFLYFNSIVVCEFPYDDHRAVLMNPDVLDEDGDGFLTSKENWRDDFKDVLGTPDVISTDGDGVMSSFAEVWRNDFWGTPISSPLTSKSYRPLVISSFRLDAAISKDAWVFHLTNTLLFALTAWILVDVILSKALPLRSSSGSSISPQTKELIIILSGLWFAAHPIHTEAVAGIVGRAELMAAICCMLGAKYYFDNIIGAAACFGAACFCTETSVAIPVVMAIGDLAPMMLSDSTKQKNYFAVVARVSIMAVVALGFISFHSYMFAGKDGGLSDLRVYDAFVLHLGSLDKLRTALYIQAKYFQLLIWPNRLSCDYGLGVINPITSWICMEMAFTAIVLSLVAVLAVVALIAVVQTGEVTMLLSLGWIFGPLLPVSHIVDIGSVLSERLLFLPSIGMAMLLCNILGRHADKITLDSKFTVALLLCIGWFSAKTLARIPDWTNNTTLFEADAATYPTGIKLNLLATHQYLKDDHEKVFLLVHNSLDTAYSGVMDALLVKKPNAKDEVMAFIFGVMGSAHLRKAQINNMDKPMLKDAERYFRDMDRSDKSVHAANHDPFCDYGLVLVLLDKKMEAYEAFKTCFEMRKEEKMDVAFTHLQNFGNLMRELSGVATQDSAFTKEHGQEAFDTFMRLLDHPDISYDDYGKWARQRDTIQEMMFPKAIVIEEVEILAEEDTVIDLD